jgi:hypothetical protein
MQQAELQALVKQFNDMKKESSVLFDKLTDKEFNRRPASGGWSIAECIDHLIVTGVDYCDKFEQALNIAADKGFKLNGELKYSWLSQRFISFVEPPVRFKIKTPKKWRPDSNINKTNAVKAYLQLQDRWIDLINHSEGWNITKVKLPSPASNLVKFTAFETLAINSAHQRRHILQAKKIFEDRK